MVNCTLCRLAFGRDSHAFLPPTSSADERYVLISSEPAFRNSLPLFLPTPFCPHTHPSTPYHNQIACPASRSLRFNLLYPCGQGTITVGRNGVYLVVPEVCCTYSMLRFCLPVCLARLLLARLLLARLLLACGYCR